MPRIQFDRDYDHRWPSGAETAFKAGWSGLVKDEVATAAIAAGRAGMVTDTAGMAALPSNFMQLQKIARDEGIDVGAASTVADMQAVIATARKAKAAPPNDPTEPTLPDAGKTE